MKKTVLFSTLFALALTAGAQSAADPVLMVINGKPVTKSEFEYSFHKNGNVQDAVEQKSVQEYVPMFINYKLKVAAAEAAHLDTLSSYKKEFLTYRDMQLTPFMVDSFFTDSIARVVYANTEKQLGGKDLIQTSHILIRLGQKATEAEKAAASRRRTLFTTPLSMAPTLPKWLKSIQLTRAVLPRAANCLWWAPANL